jgi:hypothetical protein
MSEPLDFRSDKMDSLEGLGVARARWKNFHDAIPDEVYETITERRGDETQLDELPSWVLDDVSEAVIEDSELLGFWLAWHLAGGFANLERAGWHRATIHRKIRRFRNRFGRHPDEFRLPWLRLDLNKAWKQRLMDLSEPVVEPDIF